MEQEYEIYKQAIFTFGVNTQLDVLIEEMSELTQALLKLRRGKRHDPFMEQIGTQHIKANVIEEIADVSICLDQAIIIFACENEVEKVRRKKIMRLEEYIDAENELKNRNHKL